MLIEMSDDVKNNPIGILDSGVGGVTVLKEILKILPNENYIYYSDSLHNPYGERTKEEVLDYVNQIMSFFIEKQCKAIVFACNTATALTIDEIRKKYPNLIIIGIEPAYKMVYDYAQNKKSLVMATPATIQSERFLNLYHHYDNGNTTLLPCSGLANLIEQGNDLEINNYLNEHLPRNGQIEVVVLGCTHYPLIEKEIQKVMGNVIFYDGGKGVAQRLKNLLEADNLLSELAFGDIIFYDSSDNRGKENRFYELLK